MKKTLLLAALLLGSSGISAQTHHLMPRFGLSLSKQNYSDAYLNSLGFAETLSQSNVKSSTGYTFGLAYLWGITDDDNFVSFALQPEIDYVQKGILISYKDATFREKEQRFFSYLEVPVLGKLIFGSYNLRGFVYGGPSVGYVMSGKYKHESQCNCDNYVTIDEGSIRYQDAPARYVGSDVFTGKDGVNRIDFGFQGGIGGSYTLGDLGMVVVEARYGTGFTDFYKKQSTQTTDATSKNRVLTFSVGFAFNLDH